jgi:RNA polymerase sigma factor (sigma-70 family)
VVLVRSVVGSDERDAVGAANHAESPSSSEHLADDYLWGQVASEDDQAAFSLLFDRHSGSVYGYALRRSGNWSTAEDVVALTFLEAWRRRGDVRLVGASARPWLFGVATNVLRNLARSHRRYRAALSRLEAGRNSSRFGDEEVVARVDAERFAGALADAVGGLPRGQRDVVWLCMVEGMTYAEAAEALGTKVGTVRSRLSRARHELRAHPALEPYRLTQT